MIKSMTGYGKAEAALETGTLTVEIRTLNGKSADIGLKSFILPKDKEIAVRQKIAASLIRGTIDIFINFEANSTEAARPVNAELVAAYFNELKALRANLSGNAAVTPDTEARMDNELLASILRFPDIIDAKKQDVITEENWPLVDKAIDEALAAVNAFRIREGEALYKDVTSRVQNILDLEDRVESLEGERIASVRERLMKNLDELAQKVDPQRFEQEMIFYLEKLDINEEKVRLREHCRYFRQVIDTDDAPGKKLGFIIQEMGREINTTGSKANHQGIQQAVVLMKDELEKIREQSMNIL
ncbi:MAG: YicC family protein [Bacteroidales bacterium]|nr:YicC family protein [Bacteroidales bacterium]